MKQKIIMLISLVVSAALLTACTQKQAPLQGDTSAAGGSTISAPSGDEWPTKPITMIVPWAAGGGSDLVVRALMPYVEKELGTSVVVVNKPGVGGWLGWGELAKAAPDGYTMAQVVVPAVYSGYLDPQQARNENLDSFTFIANQSTSWATLTVRKDDPRFATLEEFVEYAKSNEVIAADSGKGSNKHMLAETLKNTIDGIQLSIIHQGGWSESYAALLGGHIDLTWATVDEARQGYEDGEIDILCVFAPERSPILPDVRTFNECGMGEILSPSARGYMMPAGVDPSIIEKVSKAFEVSINNPEHIAQLEELSMTADYIGGEDYLQYVKDNEEIVIGLSEAMGWK